jgi:hypothetical protein
MSLQQFCACDSNLVLLLANGNAVPVLAFFFVASKRQRSACPCVLFLANGNAVPVLAFLLLLANGNAVPVLAFFLRSLCVLALSYCTSPLRGWSITRHRGNGTLSHVPYGTQCDSQVNALGRLAIGGWLERDRGGGRANSIR